jgi:hypothetical protein
MTVTGWALLACCSALWRLPLNRIQVPCPVGLDPLDDDDTDGLPVQEGLRDS